MGASDRLDQAISSVCLAYLLQILRFQKKKKKKPKEEGRGDWEVERGVTYKWCAGGGGWRVGAGSLVVILDMRPNHYWSSRKYHNVARDG